MKKILAVLLTGTSVVAFADSFQEFNNNAYLQYNNTSINQGQGGTTNGWTLGTTIQSKTNVWVNAEAYGSTYNSNNFGSIPVGPGQNLNFGGASYSQFLMTGKAGYAFQFFNGDSSGFQVIPYATYSYGTTMGAIDQSYGLGIKPEYRLMNDLKFSIDMTAYDATQDGGGSWPAGVNPTFNGQANTGNVQDFRYTVNPEVQYDISKLILVGVGYKFDQSFNNEPNTGAGGYSDGNSTVYARVGWLF